MSDEEVTPEVDVSIDFAVVLVKKEGQILIQPLQDQPQPENVDEIYEAICVLKRNIEAQHTAAAIQQAMVQAAMQAQGVTQSGIVVPGANANG